MRWRLGRRPELDGLRGIAILLVVASHSYPNAMMAEGPAGVSVFFALSGFLITSILVDEHISTGRVALRAFYVRRARRLFPALAVFLAVIWGLRSALSPVFATPRQLLFVALYVGNWPTALSHRVVVSGIGHCWSLAVEEQFYIVWPLALILALRYSHRAAMAVACVGAASSLVERFVLWDGGSQAQRVYYGTDTAGFGLMVGCAAALWLTGRPAGRGHPRIASAAVLGVLLVGLGGTERFLWVPVIAPLLTVVVLLAATQGDQRGWLAHPWLRYVGRRSYAWYLWHLPLIALVAPALGSTQLAVPAMIGLSWVIAMASWRYVERPWLQDAQARPADEELGPREARLAV